MCLTITLTFGRLCLTITAMARPTKPAKDRQSEIVGVRFTPTERKAFDRAAQKARTIEETMKTLCVEQVKAILNKARQSSTRDWCAFLLTFRHALRSQEVRQLKLTDVDTSNLTITISRVKGSRSGVQSLDRHKGEPLLDEVLAIRTWLRERVEDGSQILFPSQKGG